MEDGLRMILEELTAGLSKHFSAGSEFTLSLSDDKGARLLVSRGPGGDQSWSVAEDEQLGYCLDPGREEAGSRFGRLLQTTDGRVLKSSALLLARPDEETVLTLSICTDITPLWEARELLNQTLAAGSNSAQEDDELRDIDNILRGMIQDSIAFVGVPPNRMTREQKIQGIGYLNERGAFRIMNSGPMVAKFYNISKYTVYNYINERERTAEEAVCELD